MWFTLSHVIFLKIMRYNVDHIISRYLTLSWVISRYFIFIFEMASLWLPDDFLDAFPMAFTWLPMNAWWLPNGSPLTSGRLPVDFPMRFQWISNDFQKHFWSLAPGLSTSFGLASAWRVNRKQFLRMNIAVPFENGSGALHTIISASLRNEKQPHLRIDTQSWRQDI